MPRIPFSDIDKKDKCVKEALDVTIGVLGHGDSFLEIDFQWYNGDWGVLIDPGSYINSYEYTHIGINSEFMN